MRHELENPLENPLYWIIVAVLFFLFIEPAGFVVGGIIALGAGLMLYYIVLPMLIGILILIFYFIDGGKR